MTLIAFGIGAIVIEMSGRSTVYDKLVQEQLTGTADMTPAGIAAAVKGTKVADVALPTCSVAGLAVDTGSRAKCFASYMRIHALEATDGRTYSQMGQYLAAAGKETSDKAQAATDPKTGQPTPNAARNVWVTETALGTSLTTSYEHPDVREAAVIGIPHDDLGEEVAAAIALKAGADATPAELRDFVMQRVAAYKYHATSGSSTNCPRARPARSSSARSTRRSPRPRVESRRRGRCAE